MLHVNLISERIERARKDRSTIAISVIVLIIVCGFCGFWTLSSRGTLKSVVAETDKLTADAKKLAPEAEEVEKMKARIEALQPIQTMVADVESSIWAWLGVFRDLHDATPDAVWFDDLRSEFNLENYHHVLKARGGTLTYRHVGECLLEIQRTQSFDPAGVKVISVDRAEDSVEFQMEANLAHPIGEFLQ